MNDFVDRLLGRVDAPPIRPLVPTLFEPASPVGAEPDLPMGTFTEAEPKPVAGKEVERVREVLGPERVEQVRDVSVPLPGKVESVRETVLPQAKLVEHVHEVPLPAPKPGDPAAVVRESVVESRTHTEHAAVSHTERVTERSLERETRTEQLRRDVVAVPRPADAPAPQTTPAPTGSAPVARAYPVEPVRAHPVARAEPAPPPPQALVVRRRKPPAEPDVHISIGRVEVTARPAPAPVAKPRPERKPLLSLDDYLRERG
ncbi:hypothetical protein [Amycolatopsis silviterrae]|uniref:DUF2382 domain-containing protein n=1 Tax=Amycolatopsis silviterrae TaxID=1656914 RepID=A0ABW5H486_9PSEU